MCYRYITQERFKDDAQGEFDGLNGRLQLKAALSVWTKLAGQTFVDCLVMRL